jgi:hypothetical protein
MISPKTILLTLPNDAGSHETNGYDSADEIVRKFAVALNGSRAMQIRIVVVFEDLFVWTTSLTIGGGSATAKDFIQRAIQADWEFNAGVRPAWWPDTPEANRMWGVHYREDRDNGRAELARMRLERYDLTPLVLTALPARNSASQDQGGLHNQPVA